MPEEVPQKADGQNKRAGCGCLAFLVVGVFLACWIVQCNSPVKGLGDAQSCVNHLLQGWKYADSPEETAKYWTAGGEPERLHNVTNYSFVKSGLFKNEDGTWNQDQVLLTYRIRSTLGNGVPIEKLWTFRVYRAIDGVWRVEKMREAEDPDS